MLSSYVRNLSFSSIALLVNNWFIRFVYLYVKVGVHLL